MNEMWTAKTVNGPLLDRTLGLVNYLISNFPEVVIGAAKKMFIPGWFS